MICITFAQPKMATTGTQVDLEFAVAIQEYVKPFHKQMMISDDDETNEDKCQNTRKASYN